MKRQPHRLPFGSHAFTGHALDRNRPIRFWLNGRRIDGFAGDTVLSAALANGIVELGRHGSHAIGLTAQSAPFITMDGALPEQAVSMAVAPALNGARFATLGRPLSGPLQGLRHRAGLGARSLDLAAEDIAPPSNGAEIAQETVAADLVVIGAGLAGLSAALAGARAGLAVTLLEATGQLGGNARLFGRQEEEQTPDETISQLTKAVMEDTRISVVPRAQVVAARRGIVRARRMVVEASSLRGQLTDYRARYIILATGTRERLPIFPGNRLPGIAGTQDAMSMAFHYGVWPGKSALFATSSSASYRLAMLAQEAGISVSRITDSRPEPQSRFIEFAMAYGIRMASGTMPARAQREAEGLIFVSQLAFAGLVREEPPMSAERLVVCGGWQPNLTLWHMAGGESRWNRETQRLEAAGGPPNMVLAGSAAGYLSSTACMASGEDAVRHLLQQARQPFGEALIDAVHESPDGPNPISSAALPGQPPAYLSWGTTLLQRPPALQPGRWKRNAEQPNFFANIKGTLDVCDIAAGVQLGFIPSHAAGIVAQERVGLIALPNESESAKQRPRARQFVPPYLANRFGADAALRIITPAEQRTLETGALIYLMPEHLSPLEAIGVVLRTVDKRSIALLAGHVQEGQILVVRDAGRQIPAGAGPVLVDLPALEAPLGSSASAT